MDKAIIPICSLLGGLAGYYLTKNDPENRAPAMLAGGTAGQLAGIMLTQYKRK